MMTLAQFRFLYKVLVSDLGGTFWKENPTTARACRQSGWLEWVSDSDGERYEVTTAGIREMHDVFPEFFEVLQESVKK